ncbi:MAG: type I pantothenate kinase [Acidimicrobiales bacterium]
MELGGDDWRSIGEPVGEGAAQALLTLVAAVPGDRSPIDSARRVGEDHLPLATLVALLAAARVQRDAQVADLLGAATSPSPFVLGLTGGVAVGKSMAAGAIGALLREQLGLTTAVVTTDGFLLPNAELEARGLMDRKGFPESYDQPALVAFLEGLASGRDDLVAPVYDHLASDVLAGPGTPVGRPDVLVLEGVNVLQPAADPATPSVSDRLHFSVYVDADQSLMHAWFTARLLDLRARPVGEVPSYFASMAGLSDDDFVAMTDSVWHHVNLPNLVDHIAPTRRRADLVIEKGDDHRVRRVVIRG